MSTEWLPGFLAFIGAVFVILLATAALTNLFHRRGHVVAGRTALAAIWVASTVGLLLLEVRQYGWWSAPPAAISAAAALLIVYAIAGRGAVSAHPLAVGARVAAAAVLATAVLPLALGWSFAMLGIDGL